MLAVASALSCSVWFSGSQAVGGDLMPGASSDDHMWFVAPADDGSAEARILYQYARDTDGPFYGPRRELPWTPLGVASWGSRVWMLFPAQEAPELRVSSLAVERNPAFGGYSLVPNDWLTTEPGLPTGGRVGGFVGTPDGVVALLIPAQWTSAGVTADPDSTAAEPVLEEPRLMRLRGWEWIDLDLPQDFTPGDVCHLSTLGPDGRQLLILAQTPDEPSMTRAFRSGDDGWTHTDLPVSIREITTLTRVGSQVVLGLQSADSNSIRLAYLRPNTLLEFAEIAEPPGAWTLRSFVDRLVLIEREAGGVLAIQRINPVDGTAGKRRAMERQKVFPIRALHLPFLMAVAIVALLGVLLFKPKPDATPINLPAKLAPLAPTQRGLALAIDLAIGAALTLVILGCPIAALWRLPLWTADVVDALPHLLMIALTLVHSTVFELLARRTIGKRVVGGLVVSIDGGRPGACAILIRNGIKAIVLLIPVLAVFAILNHHLQGLGDLIARTVVAAPRPETGTK